MNHFTTTQNQPPPSSPLSTEIIVRGVLRRHSRVLLARQLNAGWWFLPGGHLELSENLATCLSRELMEEAEISVGEMNMLGLLEHSYSDDNGLHHEINIVIEAVPLTDVGVTEEHLEFNWFTLEEIKTLELRPQGITAMIDGRGPNLQLLPHPLDYHE